MKKARLKYGLAAALAAGMIAAAVTGGCLMQNTAAYADGAADDYTQSYRNQLAYSAASGWNNDPNGLLFANGVYHMYYQYTWDDRHHSTEIGWNNMSWGHATSTDLVHWEEKPVAIPAYWSNPDSTAPADHMMFSGSAVYDEYNSCGLFDVDSSTGKVVEGQGIVAVLTQPYDPEGGQRQILAYSKDNGDSFEIYGEVLSADAEGSIGDGEFRDPKVFWNYDLEKWLMYVGGGSVRVYSSDNLKDWTYVDKTGYWGECPDISRFDVDGNGTYKYVLVVSPEDKLQSHSYNGTNRADTYYPAEYYVVGDLDDRGVFKSTQPMKRLSEGIDCYAFQSFNNVPDGKVYGVSWAASWKTVGEYAGYRKAYNGGMTVICQMGLVEKDGEYVLTRKPVENYSEVLRGNAVANYSGKLEAGTNALAGVRADIADLEVELDFTGSAASYAELNLRVSSAERTVIRYEASSQTLTLDRSKSSLLAENTSLYKVPYSQKVELIDGKLSLRVLLDRAFVSVFANGGTASYFSAVFPSAVSNGMQLISDGDLNVKAKVYALNSIFGITDSTDDLIVTTDKLDMTVGAAKAIIASSFASSFDEQNVGFRVTNGSDIIKLVKEGGIAYVTAVAPGEAEIEVTYPGKDAEYVKVFSYVNGFSSDVAYTHRLGGDFSYVRDDGLRFSTGKSDAFMFSNTYGKDFVYSATFTPVNDRVGGSQAGGLMFGVSDNLTNYWVATADLKDGRIKLWQAGVGDLKTAGYDFADGKPVKLSVAVNGGVVKIFVNDGAAAVITYTIPEFIGGTVGLNVYNAQMAVTRVLFTDISIADNQFDFGGEKVLKVVNVTDGSVRLNSSDYKYENGVLTVEDDYLATLEANSEYVLRVVTTLTDFDVVVKTEFTPTAVAPMKTGYNRGEELTLTVSSGVEVYRVLINGEDAQFVRDGGIITVHSDTTKNLAAGSHTVKVYTSKGRPQTEFTVTTEGDFRDEDVVAITHTFLYIDIAIFAALIVGYAVISIVLKRKSK